MISAQLLLKVDSRLKQITGYFQLHFGGLDITLKGYLRQLPSVRSTPIYKQLKHTIIGLILWRNLKFYELNEVTRQANLQFSSTLTKIENSEQLDEIEITLIEHRFCTVEEAEARCPQDGLPYQTVYVNNIYYKIITNIDVTDRLANGAVGKLIHVETNDEGLVKTIWLEFPDLPQIGEKIRRKKTNFALSLQNNRITLTTKLSTTIDAVFSRFINERY
ncbi:ATP-dependent DNA helicase [Trichonephila clavipes]|nr:ATP-dependent DNA helicase [Trichonephila clavipes]